MSELPGGLAAEPLTRADVEAVTQVWRACERHDDGAALVTAADVEAIWQRPSFAPARHSRGVRDGPQLVAFALLQNERTAWVWVLPSHRGRGIGTALRHWVEETARAAGGRRIGQSVSERERAASALLRAAGYEPEYDSWIFAIDLAAPPPAPVLPDGYALRDFVPGRDEREVHRVIETAFSEWPDRTPERFEDWLAEVPRRPGFAPALLPLVVHRRAVVGAAALVLEEGEGWVAQLAVDRAHRGRGLARVLLEHAFGVTWRAGYRRCGLSTDSRTGARGLYEHVGMRVTRTYTRYATAL